MSDTLIVAELLVLPNNSQKVLISSDVTVAEIILWNSIKETQLQTVALLVSGCDREEEFAKGAEFLEIL